MQHLYFSSMIFFISEIIIIMVIFKSILKNIYEFIRIGLPSEYFVSPENRSILESYDTAVIHRHIRLLVERFNGIFGMC